MDDANAPDGEKDARLLLKGKRFFARPWVFVKSAPAMEFLPPEGPVEVAFAGRSNAGKSSLINALVNQKGLARASRTPGRTQELNYFTPVNLYENNDVASVAIVDMPGYGFAKAPKEQVKKWTQLIFSYLRARSTLLRVFVLVDARHGLKKNDLDVLQLLDDAAVSYQIAFSKTDKIKDSDLKKLFASTHKKIAKRPACYPAILATSSQTHNGLDELRSEIVRLAS